MSYGETHTVSRTPLSNGGERTTEFDSYWESNFGAERDGPMLFRHFEAFSENHTVTIDTNRQGLETRVTDDHTVRDRESFFDFNRQTDEFVFHGETSGSHDVVSGVPGGAFTESHTWSERTFHVEAERDHGKFWDARIYIDVETSSGASHREIHLDNVRLSAIDNRVDMGDLEGRYDADIAAMLNFDGNLLV